MYDIVYLNNHIQDGVWTPAMRWFTTTIYIHLLVGYIYHKPSSDWIC